MDSTLHDLEEYFETNHKNKIFFSRLTVDNKTFQVMYDYDKKEEVEKFIEIFIDEYNKKFKEVIESGI